MVKLGDVINIAKGKKHNPLLDGKNRYINIEDLHNPSNLILTNDDGTFVSSSDLIIAWDGANAGKVGVGYDGVIGSTLARLRLNRKDIDSNYLFWYLESKNSYIKSQRTGATIPHVNGETLKQIQIPLPPLTVQKEIAEILDTADALRKKDNELLKKYDELAQSIFIEMFGDPVRNEKGWEVKKLDNLIKQIKAGSSYGGEEKELEKDELGVLKVSAVTSGFFRPEEFKAVKKSIIDKDIVKVKKGDFLFSRANTRELVGATCIVDNDYENLFLPDKLWKIDFDKTQCETIFIKTVLSSQSIRFELNKTATGTSGSMLNISMPKLRDLLVIVPPLTNQKKFSEKITNLNKQNKELTTITHTNNLFHSLLQKAFKGELT